MTIIFISGNFCVEPPPFKVGAIHRNLFSMVWKELQLPRTSLGEFAVIFQNLFGVLLMPSEVGEVNYVTVTLRDLFRVLIK